MYDRSIIESSKIREIELSGITVEFHLNLKNYSRREN